jgi:endonuclease/exonuclease/phosphatase family metal-dependent hydrolase
MKPLRVATCNFNTWINRDKKKITNSQLWEWVKGQTGADLVILTEAATPPPADETAGWSIAHRPGGFPRVSGWGTLIAGRGLRVERITHFGDYELDTNSPGSLTAADVWRGDEFIATVIGLYLPYRKDKKNVIVGHPTQDLMTMRGDFTQLFAHREGPFIVVGDLNDEHSVIPAPLSQMGAEGTRLVDPFAASQLITFEQDWSPHRRFKLDYIFVSESLAERVTQTKGGIADFPDASTMSDHAPLMVEVAL